MEVMYSLLLLMSHNSVCCKSLLNFKLSVDVVCELTYTRPFTLIRRRKNHKILKKSQLSKKMPSKLWKEIFKRYVFKKNLILNACNFKILLYLMNFNFI